MKRLNEKPPCIFFLPLLFLIVLLPQLALAQSTITFAVIGDYGEDNEEEQAVADLIDSLTVDFIVTTGDNSYGNDFDQNVGQYYSNYIGNYQGVYGTGSPENRFFPSLGNHDNVTNYLAFFTLPGAGIPGSNTSGNERYYDFIRGPVHFFVVNSCIDEPDGVTGVSAQAQWLQQQLAASAALWKIVYFHHPPYSSGKGEDYMRWPFEDWGATAVLNGHHHAYQRIHRDDNNDGVILPYFVNGLGGSGLNNFSVPPVGGTMFQYNGNHGAMLVSAGNTEITFELWSIENGGTLIDSYTIPAGNQPAISVIPNSYNFGEVAVNSSSSKIFEVRNDGTEDLSVSAATLVGSHAGEFGIVSGGAPFTLAPGQSQEITLSFNPISIGAKNAVLRIESNDPDDNPFDVPLSGSGIGLAPFWSIPPTLEFPEDGSLIIDLDSLLSDGNDPNSALAITYQDGASVNVSLNNATHVATLTAPLNFNGSDEVIFTATDPAGLSASDTVEIQVAAVNDPPLAANFPDITFPEEGSFQLDLDTLASDADHDDSELDWISQVLQAQGLGGITGQGGSNGLPIEVDPSDLQIQIDPLTHIAAFSASGDSSGLFTVKFTVSDPGGLSDSDTFLVTVTPVNDAPFVANPIPDASYGEDSGPHTVVGNLNSVFSDPDPGDMLQFSAASDNPNIQASINAVSASLIIDSSPDSSGAASIIVTASDGNGLAVSDTFSVTILPVNDPPVTANFPDITFPEEGSFQLDLDNLASDADNDDSELDWISQVLQAQGLGGITGQGGSNGLPIEVDPSDLQIVIDPLTHIAAFSASGDSSGLFTVKFTVTDPGGLSDSDTFTVTVTPVNDAPFVANPIPDVSYGEDSGPHMVVPNLNSIFSDPDPGDILQFSAVSDNPNIQVSINAVSASLAIDSSPDSSGTANIIVTASDGNSLSVSDTFTVSIFPLNDPPIVSLPLIEFEEDSIFIFDLDTLVTDIDTDTSNISWSFAFPANMLAAIQKQFMAELDLAIHNNKGILMGENDSLTIEIDSLTHITTISATPNFYGLDIEVIFTALDDSGASHSDSTTISIFPANDPPLIVAPLPPAFFDEDDTLNYPVSSWFPFVSDPDDPVEQLNYLLLPGQFVSADPGSDSYLLHAPQNWFGSDTLTLIVSDGLLADSADFYVTVNSVNDPPTLELPQSVEFTPDSSFTLNIWEFAADVETADSLLSYDFNTSTDSLLAEFDALTGELTLSAQPGFSGTAFLHVTASDDSGATALDSMEVRVSPLVGISSLSGEMIPTEYILQQNYPNPFNPVTHIRFGLPQAGPVRITVYNILGQRVALLLDERREAGYHSINFEGAGMASGIYLYHIQAGGFQAVRKMLLLR